MKEVRLDKIRVEGRHRRELGDIAALAESIEAIGLLHPVVVRTDNVLVAGERRVAAYKRLCRETIPARVVDVESLARGERDENFCRKDFTPSEMVSVARAVEEEVEAAAAKRKKESRAKPGEKVGARKGAGKLPAPKKGDTRDHLAALVGTSGRTFEKASDVVDAARKEPEKYAPLLEEMDRTGRVAGVHKKLTKARAAEKIERRAVEAVPEGRFDVIVIDPPWRYGRSGDDSHRASNPYPDMSVAEICAVGVPDLARDDCVLWLWTTNSFMSEAYQCLDSWGFAAKTILTWDKVKIGLGDWLRNVTEHCILAVRGNPVVRLTNQATLVTESRREHSRKPEAFYSLVERLCPGSRIEMFAREKRKGWAACGIETEKFSRAPA